MHKYIPLILVVVTTNAISQLLLKHGMNDVGRFDFNGAGLLRPLPVVAFNPFIIGRARSAGVQHGAAPHGVIPR